MSDDDNGVLRKLGQSLDSLGNIEKVYPKAQELVQRLSSVHIELKDIAGEIGSEVENIDFDPSCLDSINQQLDLLNTLEQKYHVSTEKELIEIRDNIAEQLKNIDNSDEELELLEQEVKTKLSTCEKQAEKLTALRRKAAKIVEEQMSSRLIPMGNNNRQVISITHLPQIAALGSSHYKVEKEETAEGTRSHMRELTQEQRVNEIAQMLSGADISDAALQNARELLDLSKKK